MCIRKALADVGGGAWQISLACAEDLMCLTSRTVSKDHCAPNLYPLSSQEFIYLPHTVCFCKAMHKLQRAVGHHCHTIDASKHAKPIRADLKICFAVWRLPGPCLALLLPVQGGQHHPERCAFCWTACLLAAAGLLPLPLLVWSSPPHFGWYWPCRQCCWSRPLHPPHTPSGL